MSERIVYLSAYHLGALAGFGARINGPEMLKHREPINVDAIVYSTMIQCGVEKFEIPIHVRPRHRVKPNSTRPNFLKARIQYFYDKKVIKSQIAVSDAFSRFLPQNYHNNPEFSNIVNLENFIQDLVYAAERKTSCMTLFPVPKIDKLENHLPPEILFPVKNLLNSFETLNPSLPYPKLSVKSSDINKFEQLINSDLFSRYVFQHGKLEQSSIPTKNALMQVVDSGKGMLQSNLDFLQVREMTISVLPITAQLIDVVFGKLPGTLADYLANLLMGLLQSEKRIVVYQLNSIFEDLVRTYITPYEKEG